MKKNHGDSYIVGTMFPLHAMTFKYVQKRVMELNKECELCINCTRFSFYLGWFTNLNWEK